MNWGTTVKVNPLMTVELCKGTASYVFKSYLSAGDIPTSQYAIKILFSNLLLLIGRGSSVTKHGIYLGFWSSCPPKTSLLLVYTAGTPCSTQELLFSPSSLCSPCVKCCCLLLLI
uniref:Uncharacterized protein n=1 Tax=Anguilla anguilla TaxID=7936 RepID=A0A0E9X8G8_ANGAN